MVYNDKPRNYQIQKAAYFTFNYLNSHGNHCDVLLQTYAQ